MGGGTPDEGGSLRSTASSKPLWDVSVITDVHTKHRVAVPLGAETHRMDYDTTVHACQYIISLSLRSVGWSVFFGFLLPSSSFCANFYVPFLPAPRPFYVGKIMKLLQFLQINDLC